MKLRLCLVLLLNVTGLFHAIALAERDLQDNLNNALIFISFSMPQASLQQWSDQAKKIQAPLVIQGLVNDSFKDTQKDIVQFAKENSSGVILDPRLFEQYHITQVPAVVVQNTTQSLCNTSNESCWQEHPYTVVYGDVGLEYALQYLTEHDNPVQPVAADLLKTYRSTS
ncbi:MAG: type-F conjugative transfer system pilin assembly protein TrbC [Gammaproteobacteria bacterium]